MGAEMLNNISDAQAMSAVLDALTRHRQALETSILEFRRQHRGDILGRDSTAPVTAFVNTMIKATLPLLFPAVAAIAGPNVGYDDVSAKLIPVIGFGMAVTVEVDNLYTPLPELFQIVTTAAADSFKGLSDDVCTRPHMAVLLMRYLSGNGDYTMIARSGLALAILIRVKFMLDNQTANAGVS